MAVDPDSCWEFADQQIKDLTAKIKAAEQGKYKGNPLVMRDMRDKWLEYRHNHGPDEVRQPL